MQVDSAPIPARPISPATWLALGVVVLALVALSLLLMGCDRVFGLNRLSCPEGEVAVGEICEKRNPNHYTCDCDCTGFGIDARIAVSNAGQPINVRQDPAGTVVGTAPNAAQGTIIGGPVQAPLNGVDETWWQVNFDNPTVDGWVVARFLTVVTGVSVLAKELDVCLPASFNENLAGGAEPSAAELNDDCSVRVRDQLTTITGQQLPPQTQCSCSRQTDPKTWDATCDAPCTSGVCLLAGSDPPVPTPDPLSAGIFSTTTTCEVSGIATMTVGGRSPKSQPQVTGFLQIHGRPCPGQSCQVGIAYQLVAGNIEFDSGTIFASDPKFVDLKMSGASEPGAINLGVFLGFNLGGLPPGTALTSVEGRRSTEVNRTVALFKNTQSIAVAVNWENGTCRLSGPLGGAVQGEANDGTLNVDVDVQLDGVIVNQPPRANAGANQTVECSSPQGAPVTLNASLTTDPDNNVAFFAWRRGSENGEPVAPPSFTPTLTTIQPPGETTYHLRVADKRFAADTSSVTVKVLDTTAPSISCNAPVAIGKLDPPTAFKAAAADTCGPAPAVVIDSFNCFKVSPYGRVKDNPSCQVTIQGDTLTIDKSGGVDVIQWSTRATDGAGNVGRKTCEIRID